MLPQAGKFLETGFENLFQPFARVVAADGFVQLRQVRSRPELLLEGFSTIFSQQMGKTFVEWVTEVRIGKARELLQTTSMRSSEIGYEVGYSDPQYFCYVFKKIAGVTPTEFRQE